MCYFYLLTDKLYNISPIVNNRHLSSQCGGITFQLGTIEADAD